VGLALHYLGFHTVSKPFWSAVVNGALKDELLKLLSK